ncbi:P-loop containing nucleoside triphosphate hydrolase protein [Armillaria mellea]|nr:P-loop containing nucleoside triphosphate hydrolase protein [Armillaria mellea]
MRRLPSFMIIWTQPVDIMLSAIPPPAPAVFLGRDDLVQEGITNLLADSPHSIIIMGFGGMGKTSLALKILNDAAVQAKYEAQRYFIPCDIVCSVNPTVEVLLQTVIKQMGLQLTDDTVKQLHTISQPTVLVFDNFETLWDHSSDQHSIQRLLAQLNSVIQITLMITMRGSVAPLEDIDWLILPQNGLSPVDESISLNIFSTISKCTIDKEGVRELIKELEGWPLAITLMAYQAKILSPKILLESW